MTPAQKTLRLVLGDQLNEKHPWFQQPDKHITHVMMEIRQETDYVSHHIQKVAAFFAAIWAFANRMGHREKSRILHQADTYRERLDRL